MINTAYFLAALFIFIRLITFTALVPIFFPKGTPNIMKVAISGIMAVILLPTINISSVSNIAGNYQLVTFIINEIMTGLVLGAITNFCFSVMRFAGQLMDVQIGLSMVNMFDPNANSSSTLIETLLYWVSFIVFLLIDGHHMLIKSLIQSFNSVGLGKSIIFNESILLIMQSIIDYFIIGLKIAIPIVLIILITDITLGLISRTVPQLNVMILGMPVKILVGLATLSLILPAIIKAMILAFEKLPSIFDSIFKVIPMVLIFASEEKTEEATPKKKNEAREKGQIARSKEISVALTLLAVTILLSAAGSYVGKGLEDTLYHFLSQYVGEITYDSVKGIAFTAVYRTALIFLPIVLPIMVMGILSSYIQTGFIFTTETMKPKLSKLNPISGFKNMFSVRSFVELFKQLLLVSIVGYIGYRYVKNNYNDLMRIVYFRLRDIPGEFGKIVLGIFIQITIILLVIAIADYIYQRYMHNKDLRMTKQEIKEEFKQDEGDPQIKSKIKQKQREIASRRMMTSVPDATVVVTNPTHLAVALKYEEGNTEAPKVVAKGADFTALKIKEIAKENDVPIIENKPLARLIYNEVEVDGEIPISMYQSVAEILALVYKMKSKKIKK